MRISVIKQDNSVLIDGEYYQVDCSWLPNKVHAIQWNNDKGHIEFIDEDLHDGFREPNQTINEFPYPHLISLWNEAKQAAIKQATPVKTEISPVGSDVIAD